MAYYTDKSWSETMSDLHTCFRRWGITDWGVDAGVEPRRAAKVNQTPIERAVTLTYTRNGTPIELTIDKWPRAVDNLRALYYTVDSLRLNEYRGVADVVAQAYALLEAPKTKTPYEVLGLQPGASLEQAEYAYRAAAKTAHPDNQQTGDAARFDELTKALEQIRKERR